MKINSESSLIKYIKDKVSSSSDQNLIKSIGDDVAVFKTDRNILVSTDMMVEDVDFELRYFPFKKIGEKLVAVNVSDIIASGGTPKYILLNIGLPAHIDDEKLIEFIFGFSRSCERYSVNLIGGDISRSGKFIVDATIIGVAPEENIKLRDTARAGDLIFVSNFLGDAKVGLELLRNDSETGEDYEVVQKFLSPAIPVEEARFAIGTKAVTSMMDISDGFLIDLEKLISAAEVSAGISINRIPVTGQVIKYCEQNNLNPREFAALGGEDYELLFTVKSESAELFESNEKFKFTCVGEIKSGVGDILNNEKENEKIEPHGFDHLQK